jgi:hypothetical protein
MIGVRVGVGGAHLAGGLARRAPFGGPGAHSAGGLARRAPFDAAGRIQPAGLPAARRLVPAP